MKLTKILALTLAGALGLSLVSCGTVTYKDGTYTAQSSSYENDDGSDDGNGYGVVELTISGGKISACTFKTYELDGTEKGEDYGKVDGEVKNKDFYNKAQKANAACAEYSARLVEAGDIDEVDAISGATVNYGEFVEAVKMALKDAEEK